MLYLDHFVSLRPSWCYSSPVVFRPLRFPSSILMLLFSCCIQTTSFPFVHPDVTLLMLYSDHIVPFVHPVVTLLLLYLDHIVPLRPSWCYSSHVVFRPHRFPSSILMLLFSCCIQTTSFPFVHPDVTLLLLYSDHIVPLRPSWCYSSHVVFRPHRSPSSILMLLFSCCIQTTSFPFVHPDVTLLMLYLDHIVPLRPSWCYSSHVVFRPHRSPSSILMLLFSCCIQTTSFPFVHPDVTLLMLYSDHIVPLRPSWCYSSHVVFRPHRFPSSILLLLFSCCI